MRTGDDYEESKVESRSRREERGGDMDAGCLKDAKRSRESSKVTAERCRLPKEPNKGWRKEVVELRDGGREARQALKRG